MRVFSWKKNRNKAKSAKNAPFLRKRQFGTEREIRPLSNIHFEPSSRAVAISRLSVVVTIFFWVLYVVSVIVRQMFEGPQSFQFTMEAIGYLIIVTFLTFSALMYLIARQGALQRFANHVRVPRVQLDRFFAKRKPSITVLIPSYDEETQVVRKTVLSAALQEFPDIRVVLLLDDDESKVRPENMARLRATQGLADEIEALLSTPKKKAMKALAQFEAAHKDGNGASFEMVSFAAEQYRWAAQWLTKLADQEIVDDHVDVFFADQVLRKLADELEQIGETLSASFREEAQYSAEGISFLFNRLVSIFSADLTVFERKKFLSLSHDPNKAMNLNSYIGLMGGVYRKDKTSDGIILTKVKSKKAADIIVPDSDFVLTLDADSILLREYCLRLVYFLEQPDNSDVAVVQTPYSSFRGAPMRLERLSGATTDIQHIIHQGMSHFNATFWVGANAVIRKRALEQIVEKEWVGGFEIKRYVQDHTVIEDTESSIDMALHGWRLVNYPERLSYSATPPDFGSLIIQRRRWANGGLLILPKLLKLRRNRKNNGNPLSMAEFFIRLNYMASIAWSNIGLIFLLAYPYDGRLLSPLILLAAVPYFLAMATDLKYCRYNYTDIIRIYGFNLILLPVNLAGTLKSLQQALTTKKTPFARTPKKKNRTTAALPYLLSPIFIVAFSIFTLWRNVEGHNWGNAAFAGLNTFASIWAIVSYIGIKNMLVDIGAGLLNLLYVDVPAVQENKYDGSQASFDWQDVLYQEELSQKQRASDH